MLLCQARELDDRSRADPVDLVSSGFLSKLPKPTSVGILPSYCFCFSLSSLCPVKNPLGRLFLSLRELWPRRRERPVALPCQPFRISFFLGMQRVRVCFSGFVAGKVGDGEDEEDDEDDNRDDDSGDGAAGERGVYVVYWCHCRVGAWKRRASACRSFGWPLYKAE